MEKPTISLHDFYIQYYQNYKQDTFNYKLREKVIYIIIIVILLTLIYYLYNK
jgi:cell division protein FtsL